MEKYDENLCWLSQVVEAYHEQARRNKIFDKYIGLLLRDDLLTHSLRACLKK
ncbi:MAG: hypothetical protein ACPGC9_00930 [Cytophagales bacterium]